MPLIFNGNNRSSSNDIPTWDLKTCSSDVPRDVQHFKYLNESPRPADEDNRSPVNRRDVLPGGKYRGIAKLFSRYERSNEDSWVISTGFLYDLGELVEMKVFIGYTGMANVDNPEVEFRAAERVATTADWMEKGGRKESDLAFIKLTHPFEHVRPFNYRNTPASERGLIGVVGYAADLKKDGERGAGLYEDFHETKWDLDRNRWDMLEYELDVQGGNVGGPVLDDNLNVIGVHTYGGARNLATVIGRHGHFFEQYIDALDEHGGHGQRYESYERQRRQYQPSYRGRGEDQELVNQILKLVRDFPSAIPQDILSPDGKLSLGQLGVPAGAVANIALSAAANAVREDVDTDKNNFERDQAFDGIVERAILAEAALIAVQEMSPRLRQNEHIFDTITEVVTELLPSIQQAGSTVINTAQEPILRLALDEIRNKDRGTYTTRSRSIPSFRQSRGTASRRGLSNKEASFADAVSETARDERTERFVNNITCEALSDEAEVKWNHLNISKSLRSSASSILEAGQRKPNMVGPTLAGKGQYYQGQNQGQQSYIYGYGQQQQQINLHNLHNLHNLLNMAMTMDDDEFPLSVECLPLRAVVAEAALQAILRVPHQDLEADGLFDCMRDVIRKHGPVVMRIAPAVIRKVAPVFTALAEEEYSGGRQYGYAARGKWGRGEYARGARGYGREREREYGSGYGRGKYGRGGYTYEQESEPESGFENISRIKRQQQKIRLATKPMALKKDKPLSALSAAEQDFLKAF
ncbi:trypsin-like serine peptidase [Aspergillus undulatus]|uniref:trypsin-like serine peptidase n=1 Tax=Aspergillus undulatus TaxID=1810928 RepID=UPI003CCE1B09